MERLTDKSLTKACNDPWDYCGLDDVCARNCHKPTPCKLPKMIHRLAEIENILGDDYDLRRLRGLVEANAASRRDKPLTQADLAQMHFERVWIDYGPDEDGKRCGEDGVVLYGRLYSIDALDGAGLEELLLDAGCRGEILDNPSGTYTVYRRQPEREEGAEHGQTDL